MGFLSIVSGMFIASILWWIWGDRRLRGLPRARLLRSIFAGFMLACVGGFWLVIGLRLAGASSEPPVSVVAVTIVWHIIALPLATMIMLSAMLGGLAGKLLAKPSRTPSDAPSHPEPTLSTQSPSPAPRAAAALSRRQLLAGAAVAAPPMLTGVGLLKGLPELSSFRVRRIDVPVVNLPRDLDGLSIAQVTDVHVGRFTRGEILRRIADTANSLHADLIVSTGDLIDFDLADLPAGAEMLRNMEGRFGLFACEGNHDLFMSRQGFGEGMRRVGVPLLVNQQSTVRIRGVPVQILGLQWGRAQRRDAAIEENIDALRPLVDPDAFKILLAHHPHAFDHADRLGVAVTFAGHTHGGQLMLTDRFGPASLMYKYYSGLYQSEGKSLVVANGVGNWFPVRLNAPAEIVLATLRRSDA